MIQVFRYEQSLANLALTPNPTIFLAGPTVRGHQPHLTSWRFEAIELFEQWDIPLNLIVPEFTERTESDKGKEWIPRWEFAGLCASDAILFWIPRTKELIGLTTNHEHGYWMGTFRHKMVYGRPDDAYRMAYLDIMWQIDAEQRGLIASRIRNTLKDTVDAAVQLALDGHIRHRTQSRVPVDSPYGAF